MMVGQGWLDGRKYAHDLQAAKRLSGLKWTEIAEQVQIPFYRLNNYAHMTQALTREETERVINWCRTQGIG